MDLSLQGSLKKIFPVQSGVGRNNGKEWKRQSFVIEIQDGSFPTEVAFDVWGDKPSADINKYGVGTMLKVRFDIRSRESEANGRYYTNLIAWSIEPAQGVVAPQAPAVQSVQPLPTPNQSSAPVASESETESDLPF